MRTSTHILMLAGLLFAAACSRSTSSDAPRPQPRPEPPVLPPPSSTGGTFNDDQSNTEGPSSTTARLGIPPGHLPEIGQCRIWAPGVPPGRQRWAKSVSCLVVGTPPAGHWLLFRPSSDHRIVRVRVVHERRPGVITVVRVYRISNGDWVRDIRPEHEPRDEELYHVKRDTTSEPTIVRPPPRRIIVRPREDTTPPAPPPPTRRDTTQQRRDTTHNQRPDNPFDRRDRPPPPAPPPPPPGQPPAPPPPPPPPLDLRPLNIPPGHLPDDGECRVWIPGTVPGQQPRPKSRPCAGIESAAPAGSWILYMPANDQDVVHVRVVDAQRAGVVVVVRIYDVHSNQLIREVSP